MYVNLEHAGVNPHRHFVFMRHTADEVVVIAVNFGDTDDELAVNIPIHAFIAMDMPQGVAKDAIELLTGEKADKTFSATEPFRTRVAAHGATMWKLRRDSIEPVRPATAKPRASKATAKKTQTKKK